MKKLILTCAALALLSACNGGIKPQLQQEVLSNPSLNDQQLLAEFKDREFSTNILSGSRSGRYNFKYNADGTVDIQTAGYSGSKSWSIKDGQLCVKTCHSYYKDHATGILYGTTNDKITAILNPK